MQFLLLTLGIGLNAIGVAQSNKINLYTIPGMGTDHRIFEQLELNLEEVNVIPIRWEEYSTCEGLSQYAQKLAHQVDTTQSHLLLGVSMGGMLAMEISQVTHPVGVVLISSAKSISEIPLKYKVGRYIPIYRVLGEQMLGRIADRERTFKDVKSNADKALYQIMLNACGAEFLKWQMEAICNWRFAESATSTPVYHIHGAMDKILPISKVECNTYLPDGTHKMIVNKREELASLITVEVVRMINSGSSNSSN